MTRKFDHLSNAPIFEAIFDIRVVNQVDFDVASFEALIPELKDRFPIHKKRESSQFTFQIKSNNVANQKIEDLGVLGHFFESSSPDKLVQFRNDGFTFNKLKPYSSWSNIKPEFDSLWQRYIKIAQPKFVTRMAMRFINRFEIPKGLESVGDYVKAGPVLPKGLPRAITGFNSKISIKDFDRDLAAHIVQRIEKSKNPSVVNYVLDIDSFRAKELAPDDPSVGTTFESLRIFKNEIFFGYITERAMENFI